VEKAANEFVSTAAAKVEQATLEVDQSLAEPKPVSIAAAQAA
jgi:hypothetical protein